MVHAVQSGHPGGSLGCTDYFVAMYFHIMKHDSSFNMDGQGEDLFFLSNGHISPVWYSTLARSGYFPVDELSTFRKLDSRLQGHPATEEGLPGIRIASGSLGQGLSAAVGAAQVKKLNKDDRYVYVLMGDGEQDEGQVWEAGLPLRGRRRCLHLPGRRAPDLSLHERGEGAGAAAGVSRAGECWAWWMMAGADGVMGMELMGLDG